MNLTGFLLCSLVFSAQLCVKLREIPARPRNWIQQPVEHRPTTTLSPAASLPEPPTAKSSSDAPGRVCRSSWPPPTGPRTAYNCRIRRSKKSSPSSTRRPMHGFRYPEHSDVDDRLFLRRVRRWGTRLGDVEPRRWRRQWAGAVHAGD